MDNIQVNLAYSGAANCFAATEALASKRARRWLIASLLAGFFCFSAVDEVFSAGIEVDCGALYSLSHNQLSVIFQDIAVRVFLLGFPLALAWICISNHRAYRREAVLNGEKVNILRTCAALSDNIDDGRTRYLMIQDAVRSCLVLTEESIGAVPGKRKHN